MAVKIRMQRNGRHKQASYRIVVADSRYPRDGRFIEILGHYDPTTTPATLKLDADKAYEWCTTFRYSKNFLITNWCFKENPRRNF